MQLYNSYEIEERLNEKVRQMYKDMKKKGLW
jgi:hypothetical protein